MNLKTHDTMRSELQSMADYLVALAKKDDTLYIPSTSRLGRHTDTPPTITMPEASYLVGRRANTTSKYAQSRGIIDRTTRHKHMRESETFASHQPYFPHDSV